MNFFSRFFKSQAEVAAERAVEDILSRQLKESISAIENVANLTQRVVRLTTEKDELETSISRRELDMKHKLGLERLRQEGEATLATDKLDALREQIEGERDLAVQAARFEAKSEAADEAREAMEEFRTSQDELIGRLLKALPSAEFMVTVDKS